MRRLFGVYRNLLLTCAVLDGISDGKSEVTFEKVDVAQAYTVLVDDRVGHDRRVGGWQVAQPDVAAAEHEGGDDGGAAVSDSDPMLSGGDSCTHRRVHFASRRTRGARQESKGGRA